MNATNAKTNAIETLERAAKRLEKALEAHLEAQRRDHNAKQQAELIETLRAEKRQLQNEIASMRESLTAQQRRNFEDGGKIIRAAQEIRAALGDA